MGPKCRYFLRTCFVNIHALLSNDFVVRGANIRACMQLRWLLTTKKNNFREKPGMSCSYLVTIVRASYRLSAGFDSAAELGMRYTMQDTFGPLAYMPFTFLRQQSRQTVCKFVALNSWSYGGS